MKNTDKELEILIQEVGVCDSYDIGNWSENNSTIKLGYRNANYKSKYSDIAFCIKNEMGIFGYFITCNIINTIFNDIIPIYCKKLVLTDFAIDSPSYAKYGLMLIDYLIKYATDEGYKAIEIKVIDKYTFFFDFLKRHYKLISFNDNYYIIIDNPHIEDSKKHLVIYKDDQIKIDDLYFLYNLGFSIYEKNAVKALTTNEKIVVNRISGKIEFPTNVKFANDEVIFNSDTRNIIYMVCDMYDSKQVKNIIVDYSLSNPNLFEVYEGTHLSVNRNMQSLQFDIKYILKMIDKGIKKIYPYEIGYDMNDNSFTHSFGGISCDEFIEYYMRECDYSNNLYLDRLSKKKIANDFNEKLNNIKCFDFSDEFSRKNLTIIFDDEIAIINNHQINKEEIIEKLEHMHFYNWQNNYENLNSKDKKRWQIKLTFENEIIKYYGNDNHPKAWDYVEWFVDKYINNEK